MDLDKAINTLKSEMNEWSEHIVSNLPNFILALVVFFIIMISSRVIKKLLGKVLEKVGSSKAVNQLIMNIYSLAIFSIGLIVALGIMNLDTAVGSILTGAGIVGFILGFAFQDIIANMFSGAIIAIRKPFTVDDIIETNDHFGKVLSIRLINTEIHDLGGNIVLIPSREILRTGLVNYTSTGLKRITLPVGISYGEDLERVRDITLNAITPLKQILKDKEIEFYYTDFGDSSINFELRFWIKYNSEPDVKLIRSDAILAIKKAYDQKGITIPFPIRTLDFGIKGGEKLSQMWEVSNKFTKKD